MRFNPVLLKLTSFYELKSVLAFGIRDRSNPEDRVEPVVEEFFKILGKF